MLYIIQTILQKVKGISSNSIKIVLERTLRRHIYSVIKIKAVFQFVISLIIRGKLEYYSKTILVRIGGKKWLRFYLFLY